LLGILIAKGAKTTKAARFCCWSGYWVNFRDIPDRLDRFVALTQPDAPPPSSGGLGGLGGLGDRKSATQF
jgi:hypothetical protein